MPKSYNRVNNFAVRLVLMIICRFHESKKLLLMCNSRGRAEKEPRISIPVPAVPVSELLAGKSQRICNSLN